MCNVEKKPKQARPQKVTDAGITITNSNMQTTVPLLNEYWPKYGACTNHVDSFWDFSNPLPLMDSFTL